MARKSPTAGGTGAGGTGTVLSFPSGRVRTSEQSLARGRAALDGYARIAAMVALDMVILDQAISGVTEAMDGIAPADVERLVHEATERGNGPEMAAALLLSVTAARLAQVRLPPLAEVLRKVASGRA